MTTQSSPDGIRRLFFDIETSPNVVLAFRAGYDCVINHDAIVQERKVICIGYKWGGEKKTTVIRWDKNQDDKEMLRAFLKVAEQADEVVGHFIDRFDMPWFRTRCLIHRLNPTPLVKTIDTKAWASKVFYFNSNKLDYLGGILGHGHKNHTEFDLWKKIVMDKDQAALDYMCKYCGRDVDLLEKVYDDLSLYCKPKSHQGVALGLDKWTCPRTGSKNVQVSKKRISASGTITYSMQNKQDGSYFQISESAYKAYLKRNDPVPSVRGAAKARNGKRNR